MRWPWQRKETRDSGGSFYDAVLRAIEAQASNQAADAGSTAAVEAASGALARAFASATVEGPDYAVKAVTGAFLAQCGRDLVRSGESLHMIDVSRMGRVRLFPCASWHWEGSELDPAGWTVRATAYGPSSSVTRNLPASGVVFVRWGSTPGQPYVGTGPLSWAATTARLQSESERSLADEIQNAPIGHLIAVAALMAKHGPDGATIDPLELLRADMAKARGRAMVVETQMDGGGAGRGLAPQKDPSPNRLGPEPTDTQATIRSDTFAAVLAATGTPPALFLDSDGTSQREAVRRWHLNTVKPMARLLQDELAEKLEAPVRLRFDNYAEDMVSRAAVVQKLVQSGESLGKALAVVGME